MAQFWIRFMLCRVWDRPVKTFLSYERCLFHPVSKTVHILQTLNSQVSERGTFASLLLLIGHSRRHKTWSLNIISNC